MASGKALEAAHAGNQDVFHPPILQISEHAQPVVSTFLIGQVEPQQLLLPLNRQTQQGVDRFAHIAPVFP